jgi:hypothetical protein
MTTVTTLFSIGRQAAVFVAGCAIAVAASAQSTTSVTGSGSPALLGTQSLTFGNGTAQSTNMGQFTINTTSGNYAVYCLDPLRFISNQSYYTISMDSFFQTQNYAGSGAGQTSFQKEFTDSAYTGKNLTSSTVWGLASQTNANTVLSNLKSLYSHAYSDSLIDSTHSQAFQYAVWEVLLDTSGSYSATANNLKTAGTGNFLSIANGYLGALNGTVSWSAAYNIGAGTGNLASTTNYNYTVFVPTGAGGQIVMTVNKVPEPGALSLAAVALIGLGYARRQRTAV